MKSILIYLIGILCSVTGLFFILINLNLLTIGYTFFKYVKFIISNVECLLFFIGIIILVILYERG